MFIVESYPLSIAMCVVTMLCWGSWANTQKLASKEWRFQLFYWDYAIGVFLFSLLMAFTLGSHGAGNGGAGGRAFLVDLMQGEGKWLGSAFLGGVIFNLFNILLVAAIDIAGMAVAFPVGVGLALVLGVITTYFAKPEGNVPMLALGVTLGMSESGRIDCWKLRRLMGDSDVEFELEIPWLECPRKPRCVGCFGSHASVVIRGAVVPPSIAAFA